MTTPPAATLWTRGLVSRADLLALWQVFPEANRAELAALCGFDWEAPQPEAPQPPPDPKDPKDLGQPKDGSNTKPDTTGTEREFPPPVLSPTPFWRVTQAFSRGTPPLLAVGGDARGGSPSAFRTWDEFAQPAPRVRLAPLPAVTTRLRQLTVLHRRTGQVDVPAVIRRVARGEWVATLPRQTRPGWGPTIDVVIDRAERLMCCWPDQDELSAFLRRFFPEAGFRVIGWRSAEPAPFIIHPASEWGRYDPNQAAATVVVLGDLGTLAEETLRPPTLPGASDRPRPAPAAVERWLAWGERWRQAGVRPVAIVPCAIGPQFATLRRFYEIIAWEGGGSVDPPATSDEADKWSTRLLELLSLSSVRVEPHLVRVARRLLSETRGDAGWEARVWQAAAWRQHSVLGGVLDPAEAAALRQRLQRRTGAEWEALRRDFWQAVESQRGSTYCGVLYVQLALLDRDLAISLCGAERYREATAFLARHRDRLGPLDDTRKRGAMADWFRDVVTLLPDVRDSGDARRELDQLVRLVTAGTTQKLPASVDPNTGVVAPEQPVGRVNLRLAPGQLELGRLTLPDEVSGVEPAGVGYLGTIESRNGEITIEELEALSAEETEEPAPWPVFAPGTQPTWVVDSGRDEYGPWCEFEVRKVRQRLRWIPPGKFQMGSPEDEPGRWPDEGPQHGVTISRGYWMFDTPVTQALWEAVLGAGANKSQFRSPDRPVEEVTWHAAQQFVEALGTYCDGLQAWLPTEAEWEYACRAGTPTAVYSGPVEILGTNNAPALDSIAWYGGNSGVAFELPNGWNAEDWPEKQYKFKRAGTHPVRQKQPNGWGLYDMLGNVWEWCADVWEDDAYRKRKRRRGVNDPVATSDDAAARRVVRGGSGGYGARYVRSACRNHYGPSGSYGDLGFRCRVQPCEPQPEASETETTRSPDRAASRESGLAEPRSPDSPARGGVGRARAKRSVAEHPAAVRRPGSPVIAVVSDQQTLYLQSTERPAWASAMGHDEFGLWAEFEVPRGPDNPPGRRLPGQSPDVVVQRLRWIPPGRFWMGSPKGEVGRFDELEFEPRLEEITAGCWMFDTPVTQELYRAVMGSNPSYFQSAQRPVERVTWEDASGFAKRLSEQLRLCDAAGRPSLGLPTEAEWEYACRAGTQTATYAGNLEILGDANAPVLDAIAWYQRNCIVDFDLSNRLGKSWFKKLEHYAFPPVGTREVRLKQPNSWGLYDMLGNVWEWCADGWSDLAQFALGASDDSRSGPAALRMVRGGCWYYETRAVRSAYRYCVSSSRSGNYLGFRCRVQPCEPGGGAIRGSEGERVGPWPVAEQGRGTDPASGPEKQPPAADARWWRRWLPFGR
jgi:formylglycine-generating enzyme required for sulfatase activity